MAKKPSNTCNYCNAPGAERIVLHVEFAKGLPFDDAKVYACPRCTERGFREASNAILSQAEDLKRRRAILALNLELKELTAQPDSPERAAAIAANRAEKSALVELKMLSPAGLKAALGRLA